MAALHLINAAGLSQEAGQCQAFAARLHQAALSELLAGRAEQELEYRQWAGLAELAQELYQRAELISRLLRKL